MPKSILLADDSLTIQKVIELTFSDTDYDLTTVGNGLEAIAAIQRSRPDLVMADVVMPGKNGYEVCETIKSNPALADIPVILLSGTFEPFDRERAERAKANAIVTKPFDSKNLLSQVEALLNARSSPTTVAVPVSAEPEPAVEAAEPVLPSSAETVQIPSALPKPDSGGYRPPWMATKSIAEIAEMTFDGATDFREVAGSQKESGPSAAPPPSAPPPGGRVEPVEFDMDDSSPFGKPVPATPFAQERPLHEVFSPFPERDNVFEFPGADLPAPDASAPATSAGTPGPDDVTQEMPSVPAPTPEFLPEPIFLAPASSEPEPTIPRESEREQSEETAVPRPAMQSEIESLAQHASISDLVSRVSAPAAISDEDVERIARRVVELISEKAVREIAWEVVPDMAEVVVRKRLRELEAESGESD